MIALDLLTCDGPLRINGERVVYGPLARIVNDDGLELLFVEWYTGPDNDPDSMEFTHTMVRADMPIIDRQHAPD